MHPITISAFALVYFLSRMAIGQTVADHIYLNDKVKREAVSLSYDQLADRFKDPVLYRMECIEDPNSSYKSRQEDEVREVFAEVLSHRPELSLMKIRKQNLDYGFDLFADIETLETLTYSIPNIHNFSSSMSCSNSIVESEKVENCDTLSFENEVEFELQNVNEDDYFKQATKYESWTLNILADPRYMVGKVSVDYTAVQKSWLGQRKGSIRHSQSFICVFERIDFVPEDFSRNQ